METEYDYDVLIIGGGPSGLSAAHELAEKKLRIGLLEAAPFIGGKPISAFRHPLMPPDESLNETELKHYLSAKAIENKKISKLPIEHGFRVYPENYYNLLDIMRRIPVADGKNVSDLFTNELCLASYTSSLQKNQGLVNCCLSKLEKVLFGLALYLPYISCKKRSLKFDEISIEKLFALEKRSPELQDLILRLTDSLSSGMLNKASSLAVINILMNYYYAPNRTGFRTFNRPTHLAWLEPWHNYLNKLQVDIHLNTKVTSFDFAGEEESGFDQIKIDRVIAIQNGKRKKFKAKYIILAIPADALVSLLNKNNEMIRFDSRLLDIYKITTLPATGVQIYYEKPIHGFEKQLIAGSMATHPWGISYVDQSNYWENARLYTESYGVISIYASITNQPGKFIKKTMQKATPNEIAYEMFTEVEQEFKKRNFLIPKRIGYSTHFYVQQSDANEQNDPAIKYHFEGHIREDKLHLCTIGMLKWRPLPETQYLGNLFLCGAYTRNDTYHVSTMESACESGRRTANAILNRFGLTPLIIHNIEPPQHIRLLRKIDAFFHGLFLPNPIELLLALLRRFLNNSKMHMDKSIREYEDLHW